MANTGPSWTDNVAVQAPYGLLKGAAPLRTTLDLRARFGAFLKIAVGRYSTAALNVGCDVIVRRVLNNDDAAHLYGDPWFQSTTGTSYGYQLINNASHYAAGVQSIAWDGQAGTAFAHGDLLCFWGQGGTGENAMPPAASGALSILLGRQRRSAAVFGGGDPACYRQRDEIRASGQRSVLLGGFVGRLAARRFDVLFDLRPRRRHHGQRRVPVHGRHADV